MKIYFQRPWSLLLLALVLTSVTLILAACGGGAVAETAVDPAAPTVSPEVVAGTKVFTQHCAACHSTVEGTVLVGPTLFGIASHAGGRIDGLDAEAYLYAAIMDPDSYQVEGFEDLMPKTFAKTLTGEELDSVVAYLLTLQ